MSPMTSNLDPKKVIIIACLITAAIAFFAGFLWGRSRVDFADYAPYLKSYPSSDGGYIIEYDGEMYQYY